VVLMGIASAVAMMMILSILFIICFSVAVFVYLSLALQYYRCDVTADMIFSNLFGKDR